MKPAAAAAPPLSPPPTCCGDAMLPTPAAATATLATGVAGAAGSAAAPTLGRAHLRRLREMYRSAGWPYRDAVEIDLLAAGCLERVPCAASGRETLRVTDLGIAQISSLLAQNRARRTAHDRLVERVAHEMVRAGRIVWRELSLRAQLPGIAHHSDDDAGDAAAVPPKPRWCIARPDVFSIRNTSVEAYAQPVVHEVKVSRADLLGDLRKPDKRAAYLDLGGECWYVLGRDAKGRPIAAPEEIPIGCGVLIEDGSGRLEVARAAVHRPLPRLPFGVWMALAKAQPLAGFDDDAQAVLGDV